MRSTNLSILALLAMAFLAFTACDAASSSDGGGDHGAADGGDDLTYASYSLEADDGGFDESAETAPFEEVLGEDMSEYMDGADELDVEDDPELNPAVELPDGADIYRVRILWGQPFANPAIETPTDWSGSLSAVGAGIKLRRVVRFEGRDKVLPRDDQRSLAFESVTLPHNDGLVVSVVVPQRDETISAIPTFDIQAGPASLSFAVEDLDGLDYLEVVDDLNNVISVTAIKVEGPEACDKGHLAGYWKRLNRRGGVFAGRWIDAEGEDAGKIAGIWGRRQNGHRVLFGVYRHADGSFGGILRGTYTPAGARPHAEPSPDAEAPVDADADPNGDIEESTLRGHFAARWLSRDRAHLGVLKGLYVTSLEGEGSLRGRWAKACAERPEQAGQPNTETGCANDTPNCTSALPDTADE